MVVGVGWGGRRDRGRGRKAVTEGAGVGACHVCMYVCMQSCDYVCMCTWMNVCMYACKQEFWFVCVQLRACTCLQLLSVCMLISKDVITLHVFCASCAPLLLPFSAPPPVRPAPLCSCGYCYHLHFSCFGLQTYCHQQGLGPTCRSQTIGHPAAILGRMDAQGGCPSFEESQRAR